MKGLERMRRKKGFSNFDRRWVGRRCSPAKKFIANIWFFGGRNGSGMIRRGEVIKFNRRVTKGRSMLKRAEEWRLIKKTFTIWPWRIMTKSHPSTTIIRINLYLGGARLMLIKDSSRRTSVYEKVGLWKAMKTDIPVYGGVCSMPKRLKQ